MPVSYKTGAKLSLLGQGPGGEVESMADIQLLDDEFDHTQNGLDANDFDPGKEGSCTVHLC